MDSHGSMKCSGHTVQAHRPGPPSTMQSAMPSTKMVVREYVFFDYIISRLGKFHESDNQKFQVFDVMNRRGQPEAR